MFNKYYNEELKQLKKLAGEFSKAHPAIAPMLEGTSQDPDVERLFEGMAFISGMIRTKLDDEFPEITQSLMDITYPQYLRPLPSSTLIAFTPKQSLMETITIEKDTKIDSIPINGQRCTFSTSSKTRVSPLRIENCSFNENQGGNPYIKISFQLNNITLNEFNEDRIRLYLNGNYNEASDLFLTLMTKTENIKIYSAGDDESEPFTMAKLTASGFDEGLSLIPYPSHSMKGYRLIQEYFLMPEKFLFIDIEGFENWEEKGYENRFEIILNLAKEKYETIEITEKTFALFITPAINIFESDASPIDLDHEKSEYKIYPSDHKKNHMEIFSVEEVNGYTMGKVEKKGYSLVYDKKSQSENSGVYSLKRKISPVTGDTDIYFVAGYPESSSFPERETITMKLLCTNGYLPGMLQTGDINVATSTSPELCTFRNIIPPTVMLGSRVKNNLWQYISHMSINLLSILSKENLKELLSLYIFPDGRDQKNIQKLKKKINGIKDMKKKEIDLMYRGSVIKGLDIKLSASSDNFASKGDLYIFGMIIKSFLTMYCPLNSFIKFTIHDEITGEEFKWAPASGTKELI